MLEISQLGSHTQKKKKRKKFKNENIQGMILIELPPQIESAYLLSVQSLIDMKELFPKHIH
jgi:hypothetical protein